MSRSPLSHSPLLRILIPLMVGIAIGDHVRLVAWVAVAFILVAVAMAVAIAMLTRRSPAAALKWRAWYGVPLSLCAAMTGWMLMDASQPADLDIESVRGRTAWGEIVEIDRRDFSMAMVVRLDAIGDTAAVLTSVPRKSLLELTTRGCDYTLQPGDVLTWQCKLEPLRNMGNPLEFDRAGMMRHRGIAYTQHIDARALQVVGHRSTVSSRLAQWRGGLLQHILTSRLSTSSRALLAAMLLGDRRLVSDEMQASFAGSGIAHVLALSGLHVGIIAMLLWWLLFPLDYLRLKKWRLALSLLCISGFAVFTGASPSVVRSSIMIGFTMAAVIFYRRTSSLNALVAAALLILVLWPASLFSVGFQLSFSTVAALLIVNRMIDLRRRHWSPITNYVVSLLVASAVAAVTTWALTAHYFHSISLLSVLSNVLVVPVMVPVMIVGAACLFTIACGVDLSWINDAFDALTTYVNHVAGMVSGIPLSQLSMVDVTAVGVWLYYVALLFLALWVMKRRAVFLMAMLAVMATMCLHYAWVTVDTPRKGLVVFNDFKSTPLLWFEGDSAFLWMPDADEVDVASFSRYHCGFMARHHIEHIAVVDSALTRAGRGFIASPYAFMARHRIAVVGRGRWKERAASQSPDTLNWVIVTKRYH